jgi:flagellar protein FliO/FliZ
VIDLFYSLLKVLLSLAIVVVLILLVVPYLYPLLTRLSLRGKSGNVKVLSIVPLMRGAFLVELEVKGVYMLILVSERGADVVYKDLSP